MIRYVLAALALKCFSANSMTKALYRRIGNTLGQKRRKSASIDTRIYRGDQLVAFCDRYKILRDGDEILELGTGWMHWYAIYLRLHFDVRITMLDVWDNRQFIALKALFSKLRASLSTDRPRRDRLATLLEGVESADSLEELYDFLDLDYVIQKDGRLDQFGDNSFACVFSVDVLEHARRSSLHQVVRDMCRILKPGGYSIHQIGIDDHHAHYDRAVSPKQYLSFSDRTWGLFFDNDVQYINRLQRSDWLALFEQARFNLVEEVVQAHNIEGLRIHAQYQHYDHADLDCTRLTIVHRKSAGPGDATLRG